ncbi:hypothetical protein BDR07DRAFT_1611677 [Suillus spraguei]|nr:hypothetical protein BDR07DRAFT_1611677 [Suillus spraguei]
MHKRKGSNSSPQYTEATTRENKSIRIFDIVIREIANASPPLDWNRLGTDLDAVPQVHSYAKMALSIILAQVDRDTSINTGSWDSTVRLWDAATGKPIGIPLRGHTDSVNSLSFSPDSTRIITGSSFKGDGDPFGGEDVTVAFPFPRLPATRCFLGPQFDP